MNRHKEHLIASLDQLDPARLPSPLRVPTFKQEQEARWPSCTSCTEQKPKSAFVEESLDADVNGYRGVCIECARWIGQQEVGL